MTRPPKSPCPICNRLIRIIDPYSGTNRPPVSAWIAKHNAKGEQCLGSWRAVERGEVAR
jgi:hypothetical protein